MTVQWSAPVRNALCDALETAIGVSAKVMLYTGAQPANCATATSGTKLAEFDLDSDWMENSGAGGTAGVKRMLKGGTVVSGANAYATTGLAAGNIGYYRIFASDGVTCHEQGAVTASGGGGDMTVDNVSVAVGQAVNLTGYQKTAPAA